ncbi:hypothetical protein EVAR_70623_1 [Eumeta japonica]|uniref:Uncharacterized protein n=1 Tax=Eumeta variegata TaxID=151549 RepID=A0A4C2A6T1_EUMVA|nr:hypothetical protein EVAR_70623_1 [Eumeta japonica]
MAALKCLFLASAVLLVVAAVSDISYDEGEFSEEDDPSEREGRISQTRSRARNCGGAESEDITQKDERNALLAWNPDAAKPTYDNLPAFEELYCIVRHKYEEIISQKNIQKTKYSHTATRKTQKLPPLELKSFDGEPENWPIFYETFRSIIHENNDLNDGERVQYLVAKLTGKAQTHKPAVVLETAVAAESEDITQKGHAYGAVEKNNAEYTAPWIATVLFRSANLPPAFETESCSLCGHMYEFSIS